MQQKVSWPVALIVVAAVALVIAVLYHRAVGSASEPHVSSQFLQMSPAAQDKYFGDILTGQFENDGFGDPLGFASGLSLISTKATFFSNYPNHRAVPGAEFQVRIKGNVKTGWDIMGLRGPVGPQEEAQLRAKYFDAEELPGVDPTNIWI